MGPEDVFPILLVAEEVDGNHGADGKEERHVDVARNVGATREYRKQTENVCREDEEEHREQIRSERLEVLLAYRRLDHIVVDGHDEHLHHSDKSARSLTSLVLTLVPASARKEHSNQNEHYYPYLCHGLRDAQVERTHLRTIRHFLVDLAVMLCVEVIVLRQTALCTERPLSGIGASDDYRQRNAQALALVGSYVPLV